MGGRAVHVIMWLIVFISLAGRYYHMVYTVITILVDICDKCIQIYNFKLNHVTVVFALMVGIGSHQTLHQLS